MLILSPQGTALEPSHIKHVIQMVLDNIEKSLLTGKTCLSLTSGVKNEEFDPPSAISCDSDTEL